ncbi:MAG: response regulator transcription factor [Syntrophomonadaceae bacterium]|nr:response regulator transcription factor [Syntrophomonadaceae bacterium]
MDSITILLADDHQLVRAGIRSLLNNLTGIEVIAEADNGQQVLELLKTRKPDLILMDIAMPEMNGLEATAAVIKDFPYIKVILLSMYANEEYVRQALHSGASGYLLKDAAPVELELAIKSVLDGATYLSPVISHKVVSEYIRSNNSNNASYLEKLTPRQIEVWKLIAEGCSTKDMAAKLGISPKTVESHRAQLMERLDTYDIVGLVKLAIKSDLIKSRY